MDQQVQDYLTKQLLIDRNVVTFRSLSRQFSLHVNAAKNILAIFYGVQKQSSEPVYATYMLTGEAPMVPAERTALSEENGTDVEMPDATQDSAGQDDAAIAVPHTKVTLVNEAELDNARAQYTHIFSEYIHTLTPAPLVDAALICAPSDKVYEADAKMSPEASMLIGRIVGPHVRVGKFAHPVASSSKAQMAAVRKETPSIGNSDREQTGDQKMKGKEKEKESTAQKPKASGALDWSKAKLKQKEPGRKERPKERATDKKAVKEEPKEEDKTKVGVSERNDARKEKDAKAGRVTPPAKVDTPKVKQEARRTPDSGGSSSTDMKPPQKRGIKRKSILPIESDSEDEDAANTFWSASSRPQATNGTKAKANKGVIVSNDENGDDVSIPQKFTKAKAVPRRSMSDAEKSLRAMMNVDDDEVIKASRPESKAPEPQDEDTEMVDDTEPVPVKPKTSKKKKEKKVVPVGRNGLKKRKVMKTRMTMDDKRYMVTEDYSSYESIDESEAVEEPAPKVKRSASAKSKKASKPSETKLKLKEESHSKSKSSGGSKVRKPGDGSKVGGQESLMNFFGKK
ncbi:DNA polymerase subunit Cdc27 [Sparassis latifolia]